MLIDVSDMPQVDIGRTIDFLMGVTLAMNAKLFRLSKLNVLAVVPEGVPADNDALSKTILAYKASLPQTTGAAEDADGSADSADSQ
ncbi:MAG: cell division protein SepF [Oscillospiraceae bacterium]|nr:MAG: cell division protein SepF [Oscillospiraceae bacterium]